MGDLLKETLARFISFNETDRGEKSRQNFRSFKGRTCGEAYVTVHTIAILKCILNDALFVFDDDKDVAKTYKYE